MGREIRKRRNREEGKEAGMSRVGGDIKGGGNKERRENYI